MICLRYKKVVVLQMYHLISDNKSNPSYLIYRKTKTYPRFGLITLLRVRDKIDSQLHIFLVVVLLGPCFSLYYGTCQLNSQHLITSCTFNIFRAEQIIRRRQELNSKKTGEPKSTNVAAQTEEKKRFTGQLFVQMKRNF